MALACTVLLAGCGSVPVSSLWKLRKLSLETLEPAALRAAVVHSPSLQLAPNGAVLTVVAVSRQLVACQRRHHHRAAGRKAPAAGLAQQCGHAPSSSTKAPSPPCTWWRIDPAALPQLQALRTRAMAWKGTDDGKRELTLGSSWRGAKEWQHPAGHHHADAVCGTGRVHPIVRNIDLAETMSAAELKQRFPVCGAAGYCPGNSPVDISALQRGHFCRRRFLTTYIAASARAARHPQCNQWDPGTHADAGAGVVQRGGRRQHHMAGCRAFQPLVQACNGLGAVLTGGRAQPGEHEFVAPMRAR